MRFHQQQKNQIKFILRPSTVGQTPGIFILVLITWVSGCALLGNYDEVVEVVINAVAGNQLIIVCFSICHIRTVLPLC